MRSSRTAHGQPAGAHTVVRPMVDVDDDPVDGPSAAADQLIDAVDVLPAVGTAADAGSVGVAVAGGPGYLVGGAHRGPGGQAAA